MYAVIEACGRQYKVQEGDIVFMEKLNLDEGASVEFDKILVVGEDSELKIGNPYVAGAKVMAKVEKNGKDPKIVIFKYKSKKGYRRRAGHRQPYTKVLIESITAQ